MPGEKAGPGKLCLHHEFASFLQHSGVKGLHPLWELHYLHLLLFQFLPPHRPHLGQHVVIITAATSFVKDTIILNTYVYSVFTPHTSLNEFLLLFIARKPVVRERDLPELLSGNKFYQCSKSLNFIKTA